MLKTSEIVGAAFLLLFALNLTDVCLTQGGVTWLQLSPANSPPPRWGHAMVYDASRQRVVLFGGGDGLQSFTGTWEWDGANWTQRFPAVSPPARVDHAMAYDLARRKTVLFGGSDAGGGLSDTWEWDGVNWTQRLPTTSPTGRHSHTMVDDAGRQRVVLFGGWDGSYVNDTWEWDGANWTQQNPALSPPPRSGHAMAYDLARGKAVLYGGQSSSARFVDTWEWSGTVWTQRLPTSFPRDQGGAALAFDPVRERVVLFGGGAFSTVFLQTTDATWEWDGIDWTQTVVPGASALDRFAHAMAFDGNTARLVVMGGWSWASGYLGDTLSHASTSPASFSSFGAGCPGGGGPLSLNAAAFGLPWIGDTFSVELGNLPAGSSPFMAFGFSNTAWSGGPLPRNLSAVGLPGCWQLISVQARVGLPLSGNTATWSQIVPVNASLVGWSLYLQGGALNAGGANVLGAALSTGGQATIGMR